MGVGIIGFNLLMNTTTLSPRNYSTELRRIASLFASGQSRRISLVPACQPTAGSNTQHPRTWYHGSPLLIGGCSSTAERYAVDSTAERYTVDHTPPSFGCLHSAATKALHNCSLHNSLLKDLPQTTVSTFMLVTEGHQNSNFAIHVLHGSVGSPQHPHQ